jgi:hypothetical protein
MHVQVDSEVEDSDLEDVNRGTAGSEDAWFPYPSKTVC